MSNNKDLIVKIGILGPTSVGKTSLISSVLKSSTELLSGSPVRMAVFDTKTEKRLSQHHKELEGSIRAGEFHPGAVSGTQESFTYELYLDPGVDGAGGIRFSILDYPGGWIDPNQRPPERESEWKTCKQWIKESYVLLVPIESAVMMEAYISDHKRNVPFILNTEDVSSVTREWAKERKKKPDEPALLIFCPVKCESYFNDNGGRRNADDLLYRHFEDYYREVINAAQTEAPSVDIVYAPVDTVGCCEITQTRWNKPDGNRSFSADYIVRKPDRRTIKGAGAVLISLCRVLLDACKKTEDETAKQMVEDAKYAQDEANDARKTADVARAYAIEDKGVFGNFWLRVKGERQKRERDAKKRTKGADELQGSADKKHNSAKMQQQVIESFGETIERLAKEPIGSRAKRI